MPNVVRFALDTERDLYVPGAGFFNQGILDIPAGNAGLLARVRYLVQPYRAVELGVTDSTTPPPDLPAVDPGDTDPDPYPQYVTDADLANPSSGPSVALRAAFGRLPAHAGSRSGYFDPIHSIYNLHAENTRRLRAAWSAAVAGVGLCLLAFDGDSLMRGGSGGPLGTTDPVGLFRLDLERRGFATGEMVHAYTGTVTDPRLVTTGGPWTLGSHDFPWIWTDVVGSTATITGTGTVLEVMTHNASGGYTIAIDGGAPVAYTAVAGATPRLITITGLSNGAHTAVITVTSGASMVFLYSAGFRRSTGFVVDNSGLAGARASATQYNHPTGPLWVQEMMYDLDCVIVEFGMNDWYQGVSPATFRADLEATVERIKATGATVILVASQYPATNTSAWTALLGVIYDVADAEDVPLIDLADRFGQFAQYNADGLGYDQADDATVHLTPAGNAHKARVLMHVLAS